MRGVEIRDMFKGLTEAIKENMIENILLCK